MRSTSPAVFLRARPGAFRFGRDNRKRPSRPPRSPPRFASVTEPRSERRPAAGFGLHFDPVGIESRLPSPAGALSCGSGVAVTISSASLSLGAAGRPETQEQRDPASAGRRSRNPPGATARDDRAQSPPGMRRVVGRATLRSKGRVQFPSCGFLPGNPNGTPLLRTGGVSGSPHGRLRGTTRRSPNLATVVGGGAILHRKGRILYDLAKGCLETQPKGTRLRLSGRCSGACRAAPRDYQAQSHPGPMRRAPRPPFEGRTYDGLLTPEECLATPTQGLGSPSGG